MPRATAGSMSARMLVAAGANLKETDPNGITPLLMAITNNHMDMARFAIEQGADVNVVDWYGRTPLWAAVETRNMDVDNGNFENGVDREAALDVDQGAAGQGRRSEHADEGDAADPPADAASRPARCRGWISPVRRRS